MIKIDNLTYQYPTGKGVHDVSFSVPCGSAVGYLGSNGAGKTTTIRALMGFVKPQNGIVTIDGKQCFGNAHHLMHNVGYLAGEISYPRGLSGRDILQYACNMRGVADTTYMHYLLDTLQLDCTGDVAKYSKGMKQKLAIVVSMLHNPNVLILDEPTSGLDPLMQNVFVELILQLKKEGKTILMSSHMVEEIERTCDSVVVIREGRIVANTTASDILQHRAMVYRVVTPDIAKVASWGYDTVQQLDHIEVSVKRSDIDTFVKQLSTITVLELGSVNQTLEQAFLSLYGKEGTHE